MCARKRPVIVLLSLVVVSALTIGCATVYVKQFRPDAHPNIDYATANLQGLEFLIRVRAGAGKEAYQDSSFRVLISASTHDSVECALYDSLQLTSFELHWREGHIDIPVDTIHKVWSDFCRLNWRLGTVTIPESVDTISVSLGVSLVRDSVRHYADTSVMMFREQLQRLVVTE